MAVDGFPELHPNPSGKAYSKLLRVLPVEVFFGLIYPDLDYQGSGSTHDLLYYIGITQHRYH